MVVSYARPLREEGSMAGLDFSKFGEAVENTPSLPKRGDTGSEVAEIQQALADRGIQEVGEVDGAFGAKTELAIQTYQGEAGLPRTGVLDAATRTAILDKPLDFTETGEATVKPLDFSSFGEATQPKEPKTSTTVVDDVRTAAVDQLKLHEGYKPYPYKDSRGFWTIGIGHLIGDGSTKGEFTQYSESNPMPEAEVQRLFQKDYEKHARIAEQYPAYETMNNTGRLALIDMTFNMGDLRVGWSNTLKLLEEGRYDEAADVIENSKYARQVGNRAKTIASQIRAAGE
jgi:lysozyme